MDKITVNFFAHVLYYKGVITNQELEEILDCCAIEDLDKVLDIMAGE